jgi:hypothetical protein
MRHPRNKILKAPPLVCLLPACLPACRPTPGWKKCARTLAGIDRVSRQSNCQPPPRKMLQVELGDTGLVRLSAGSAASASTTAWHGLPHFRWRPCSRGGRESVSPAVLCPWQRRPQSAAPSNLNAHPSTRLCRQPMPIVANLCATSWVDEWWAMHNVTPTTCPRLLALPRFA